MEHAATPEDPFGVATGWWATDGTWRAASPEGRDAVRRALGADEHPDGPPHSPTWFVTEGAAPPVHSPCEIHLEDGTTVPVGAALPADLPLGAHRLQPLDGGPTTALFVVPAHVRRPQRSWGWAVQLYGARSRRSWGHGDLADLADLARWSASAGATWLAHEPLGAHRPAGPSGGRPADSPYSASSRRFPSPMYLRVEDVPGAETAADAVEAAARAGRALNERPTVDRGEVWRLKLAALEAVHAATRAGRTATAPPSAPAGRDAELDRYLGLHATFCALAEAHDGGWQDWPADVRRPGRTGVARFVAEHAGRVDLWRWATECTTAQLAAAARAGAELLGDLAVGFDPGGSDAWADGDLLAEGCRIGAPPDDFAPDGQEWGLTPYVPWRLRADGYRAWLATLRAATAHVGALRVDHVMGLFRLFWVPAGERPPQGTYVAQFGTEMLDLAAMVAAQADVVLVGEDLGTVEPSVRAELGRRNVLGYRVAWFEDEPPSAWPTASLACATTHDLPTVVGLWTGADGRRRTAAGLPADPDGDALMRDRLVRLVDGDDPDRPTAEVVVDLEAALAPAPSLMAVVALEDVLEVAERPNQPGTVDELPNWRAALPVTVDDLPSVAVASAVADAMNASGRDARDAAPGEDSH